MNRTVLIGIARMGSSRLPGKVLMDLGGQPVLEWIVDAAHLCNLVDDIVIATTTDLRDDAIEDWCKKNAVDCYRGSEDDVLRRFTEAAHYMHANVAVRVTCDCPLLDPTIIDQVIALREATGADYASNIDPPTWPDGMDCEAITVLALDIANHQAKSKIDRECVTTWIQHNRYLMKSETLICPLPGMHKERWVLDTEDDYKLCQKIAKGAPGRSWLQVKQFLDSNPGLRQINAHHPRNERYYAALANEPLEPRSYDASRHLLERAERTIPLAAQTFSKSKIQYPADSPLFITHGDGGYCYDVDGNRYVDLVGGLLPVILGHRDPDVDAAIRNQLSRGISFSLATELEAQLSETLCRLIPCAEMVRYGKNGTDVTSAAIRLARAYTGRNRIVSSGYHGWADWAVAHDALRNNGVPYGVREDIVPLRHGDTESLFNLRNRRDIAAVIVEPETNPEFLQKCRDFCNDTDALLIFDEIITGFRFDIGGAQKPYGITPDLACFGKSMANGMPISALVGRRDIMQMMERISYSGTFFGETLSLAAAIATIDKLQRENVIPKIRSAQNDILMLHRVPPLATAEIKLRGTSFLPRLEFPDNDIKTLFIQEMAQQGVLIIASHNLSYAHGPNEIQRVVTAYKHTIPIVEEAMRTGTATDRIRGRSIPSYANVRASA